MRKLALVAAAATFSTLALTPALASSASGADAASAQSQRAGKYVVTATVNTDEAIVGGKVVLKGKVTPAARGEKVVLQKRYAGEKRWIDETSAKLKKSGAFKLVDDIKSIDARSYRVFKPGSKGVKPGYSPILDVTAYRWSWLTDLPQRTATELVETWSVSIDATEYTHSLAATTAGTSGLIDYNLGRKCTRMTGTFGITDNADLATSVSIGVTGDGAALYSGSFTVGHAVTQTIGLRDVFRLGINYNKPGTGAGQAAVGGPKVLCSF